MQVESKSINTILDDGATLMKQNRKDTPEKTLKNEKSELKTRMNKRRSKSGTKKKKTLFKVESAPVPDNRKLLQSRIMMTYPASIVEKIFPCCAAGRAPFLATRGKLNGTVGRSSSCFS